MADRTAISKPPRGMRQGKHSVEQLFHILRERIANHALPPGSKLRETELSEEFGVSRTRIREVFTALQQRGLIDRIPNRGAVVTQLGPRQVFELFDVREMLEALCVRRAAKHAPDGHWDDLIETFAAPLERSLETGDYEAYITALMHLNRRIVAVADHDLAAEMLDLIHEKTLVISRRVIILPGRAQLGLKLHRELLQALKKRDGDAAERLKREIISSAREYLHKYEKFVF